MPPSELVLSDALTEPATWSLTPEILIASALKNRLDLQAIKMAVAAAEERIAYEKSRYLRSLELGISTERSARNSRGGRDWLAETAYASAQSGQLTPPSLQPREDQSTDWVTGPEIAVELPIFDQNQAQIARAEYVHQQALKMLDALERELTQDAHIAFERVKTAANNVRFYKENGLPLREQGLTLAQGAYTAGRTTLLSMQEAQRALLSARSGYIEALTQYASAVVEIERLAGRPFTQLVESVPSPGESQSPVILAPAGKDPAEKKP
jgi:cobalt-zinc-cadmium efflux system outer membrane protein